MRRTAIVGVLLVAVVAIAGPPALSRFVERRLVEGVENHFDSTVGVSRFRISVFPRIEVTGSGLELRRRDAADGPPLITVDEFAARTSVWRLLGRGIQHVSVTGLNIRIPPDPDDDDRGGRRSSGTGRDAPTMPEGLVIDEIVSTGARLEIAPDDASGTPLVFDIPSVRLEHFSLDGPASYTAVLTNPKPRGGIASSGQFGPWRPDHPRVTPLSGEYTLSHADMSVFEGLSGTLESAGRFSGRLEAIDIAGSTTMPDFLVETGGHAMPLDTTFEARVDGTNGNTYLDRVSARLADSVIEARGEIAGAPDTDGKTIRLDVRSDAAELRDFIYLVVSEPEPPMSGRLEMNALLELPPGEGPVPDKLLLDGRFTVREGRFASDAVQARVDELSRRGRGQPANPSIDNVLSDFSGEFTLRDGRLRLQGVRFGVRGAEIVLKGQYTLDGGALAFEGELRLDATLSQTTTGFTSFLLRIIDPLFRHRGAGAVLPIKVEGTVSNPKFGVDMVKALTWK